MTALRALLEAARPRRRASPARPPGHPPGEAALLAASDWAEIAHALGPGAAHAVAPMLAVHPNPGEGRSRLRGRGLDYAESRAYQPGDDLRAMHWGLLARTGRPYVRVHEEEHAAPWHALVDAHGGMLFGTRVRPKASQAARAAMLAAALQASSTPRAPLHCTVWTEAGLETRGFGAGPVALRRMASWLGARSIAPVGAPADPARDTAAFDAWVARLRLAAPRPVRVVLCSDFAWLDRHGESTLRPLGAQCQILAARIADPVELALPDLPAAHFDDHHGTTQGWLEPGVTVRAHFRRAAQRRRERVDEELRAVGARGVDVLTSDTAAAMRARLLGLMR